MANVVAIVGRSNVGKSTFFNRLIGQRNAIMDSSVNTTRDRHYGYVCWNNKSFVVVDTGGYMSDEHDIFAVGIGEQIQIALNEANIILFMVDCKDGLTALDRDFSHIVRKLNKPILLVANKAESLLSNMVLPHFYSLGFGEPFAISAINGSGTGDLLDAISDLLKPDSVVIKSSDLKIPRFTILGRPNVGKSSLLNALLGEKRNMVSSIAGTTRDSIDTEYRFYNKHFILTDTAGIRRKSKVKVAIEFYSVLRAIKSMQDSDVCLIMIDAQTALEAQDIALIALAHRHKKGIVLLVNKWDLIDKNTVKAEVYKQHILRKLASLNYIPVVFVSTIYKQRIYKVVEKAFEVYQNKIQKITTSELNRAILPIIAKTHPPAIRGKYIHIKYCTQVRGDVPTFAFFCNFPSGIQSNYKSYLENQLRLLFNFEGVPIQIVFKKK